MKISKRNSVFETNSSSIHTLSIIKDSNIEKYPDTVVFLPACFGWENEIYEDTETKASYVWELIKENSKIATNTYVEKITNILNSVGIHAEFPYNNSNTESFTYNGKTYEYNVYVNSDGVKDDGYIDHGADGLKIIEELSNNPTMLLNFLFDNKSYIITGNDNEEYYISGQNYGDSWILEKGN